MKDYQELIKKTRDSFVTDQTKISSPFTITICENFSNPVLVFYPRDWPTSNSGRRLRTTKEMFAISFSLFRLLDCPDRILLTTLVHIRKLIFLSYPNYQGLFYWANSVYCPNFLHLQLSLSVSTLEFGSVSIFSPFRQLVCTRHVIRVSSLLLICSLHIW